MINEHFVYLLFRPEEDAARWPIAKIQKAILDLNIGIDVSLIDGVPFYVGIGKGNRDQQHEDVVASGKKSSNPFKDRIIKKLLASIGEVRRVRLFEGLSRSESKTIEILLIGAIKRRHDGGPLTNMTSGGDGALDPSPELRAKMSEAAINRVRNPEAKARRAAILGSPETRSKMSASAKARSPESFNVALAAMKTPEALAKASATKLLRGSTAWPPERRAKVAQRKADRLAAKEAERAAHRPTLIENRRKASLARWAKPDAHENASAKQTARYATDEGRAAAREIMNRPEVVAKLRAAGKRHFEDPANREANRQRGIAQYATDEARRAQSMRITASHSRPEVRAKMSAAKAGKPPPNKGKKTGKPSWNSGLKTGSQSPEERARRSAALIEVCKRPEIREMRRQAALTRWARHRETQSSSQEII